MRTLGNQSGNYSQGFGLVLSRGLEISTGKEYLRLEEGRALKFDGGGARLLQFKLHPKGNGLFEGKHHGGQRLRTLLQRKDAPAENPIRILRVVNQPVSAAAQAFTAKRFTYQALDAGLARIVLKRRDSDTGRIDIARPCITFDRVPAG